MANKLVTMTPEDYDTFMVFIDFMIEDLEETGGSVERDGKVLRLPDAQRFKSYVLSHTQDVATVEMTGPISYEERLRRRGYLR
jgi:hypothetical protein